MQNGQPPHGTDTHHLAGGGRAKRRTFTAAQKLAILREIDACPAGQQGEVLRKDGTYSSHLTKWRRQRAAGALVPTAIGPWQLARRFHGGNLALTSLTLQIFDPKLQRKPHTFGLRFAVG